MQEMLGERTEEQSEDGCILIIAKKPAEQYKMRQMAYHLTIPELF